MYIIFNNIEGDCMMMDFQCTVQRSQAIDQLKGLSILCITLLHFEEGVIHREINLWIGSFMISAFYFTSGWLLGLKGSEKLPTVRELACKRWNSLGKPYLWFSALILLFDFFWIFLGFDEWRTVGRDFYKTLTLRGIGTLWFLPALFFGELIAVWLIRRKKVWQLFALMLTLAWYACYGYWASEYAYLNDYFRIIDSPFRTVRNILGAWPVIFFSYYLSILFAGKLCHASRILLLIFGLILAGLSYICANFLFSALPFYFDLVWGWFTHVIGPFGLFLLFTGTQKLCINQFFTFWGRNSLILMATHYSIYQVMCETFCSYYLKITEFAGWITITCFIVTILVEYPTAAFYNYLMKRK